MPDTTASPAAIRNEFERLIVNDLLGPTGGQAEVIPSLPVPRDRYLVGLLAPRHSYVSPSRFDAATAADPSGGTSEDHVASPPQLIPSALGMTFVVPGETTDLEVEASWGHYVRETLETDDGSERIWRRSPAGATLRVPLPSTDDLLGPLVPEPEFAKVVVEGAFAISAR